MAHDQGRKRCPECDRVRALGDFHRNKAKKDGRASYCKKCTSSHSHMRYFAAHEANKAASRDRSRSRREAQPEAYNAAARKWREAHPEVVRAIKRRYREKHGEKIRAAERQYHEAYQEDRNAACRKSYRKYAEQRRAASRQHRIEHPAAGRLAARRRRARRRDVDECFTAAMEAFVHGFWDDECTLCGAEIDLCADHWLPLSKGHALTMDNAVLLCRSCNSRKGAKLPADFLDASTVARIERMLQKQQRAWMRSSQCQQLSATTRG